MTKDGKRKIRNRRDMNNKVEYKRQNKKGVKKQNKKRDKETN